MTASTRALVASAAAGLLPSMALAVLPTAVFDLRVHDTGGKEVTITHAGDSGLLDLYVMVKGSDADPTNDKFQIATGRFVSSSGGLKGNLQGIAPPSPFNGNMSSPGTPVDVDGDGDLDVGNLTTSATGKYVARRTIASRVAN